MKFNDPKFKVRIDMKHSYFSNYSIFSVVETVVVCQKLIHVAYLLFLLYKEI